MIESFFSTICAHAPHAHWIIFGLLLLGGINFPISEDVLIIGGGAIASACIPDYTIRMFLWILIGCYIAAWECYWIGRLLGPKLYRFRLFSYVVTPERLNLLRYYYAKLGIFTFIIGRFCPGGVRNALFLSSGLTRMPFHLFMIRDGVAALLSTTFLFSVGYTFGAHLDLILFYFYRYTEVFLVLLGVILLVWLIYRYFRCKKIKENL